VAEAVKKVPTAGAKRGWCRVLAIGVGATILLAGCGSKPNVVGPEAVPVNVTAVVQKHDDDDVGLARHTADRRRHGRGCRVAPPAVAVSAKRVVQ